jgi:hypothetical protein
MSATAVLFVGMDTFPPGCQQQQCCLLVWRPSLLDVSNSSVVCWYGHFPSWMSATTVLFVGMDLLETVTSIPEVTNIVGYDI